MWNRELEGASAWRSFHFHGQLVLEYFLVSSKPSKLFPIGDVAWAGTSSGKQRQYCILPSGSYRYFTALQGFQLQRKPLDVKGLFQRDLHLFGWQCNTNYEMLSFRHHSDSPTYQFHEVFLHYSDDQVIWHCEIQLFELYKEIFCSYFSKPVRIFFFSFIGNLVEKSLFEIFWLIINSIGRNKNILF